MVRTENDETVVEIHIFEYPEQGLTEDFKDAPILLAALDHLIISPEGQYSFSNHQVL